MPNSRNRARIVLIRAVPALQPLRTHAVQRDERLLILALDGDGVNAGTAVRLEDRFTVGAVGLVPATVCRNVEWRHEVDVEAARAQPPRPEVGRGTGFHNDEAAPARSPEVLELRAGEPLPLLDEAWPRHTAQ